MKTFLRIMIDHEDPTETGAVVFLAEDVEEAIIQILEEELFEEEFETITKGNFDDVEEEADLWMYSEYPITIQEVEKVTTYAKAPALSDFQTWDKDAIVELLNKKYKK